jgi:hypothetical protein
MIQAAKADLWPPAAYRKLLGDFVIKLSGGELSCDGALKPIFEARGRRNDQ